MPLYSLHIFHLNLVPRTYFMKSVLNKLNSFPTGTSCTNQPVSQLLYQCTIPLPVSIFSPWLKSSYLHFCLENFFQLLEPNWVPILFVKLSKIEFIGVTLALLGFSAHYDYLPIQILSWSNLLSKSLTWTTGVKRKGWE